MTAILSALALWIALATRRAMGLYIFLSLPATAAHELAHWIVALLSGSRPQLPSLWPKKTGEHWTLGSVAFTPGWFSAGLVALAPLWCLTPVAIWGLFWRTPEPHVLQEIGYGVIWGYLAYGALPSPQDWVIALKYPVGSAIVLLAVLGAAPLVSQRLGVPLIL